LPDGNFQEDHRGTHLRTGVLSSAVWMLGSSYCEMALGLAQGIFVMRLIGPVGRGIMRMVDMAHKYLTHSHLGILHGVSKELPLAIGRADTEDADSIEAVGATFVTTTGLLAGLGLFLFGWVSRYGSETKVALMVGGGLLVTQQVYALYRCVLRAWGRFPLLAGAAITNTVARFIFIILGAMLFRVTGAMLGWLLASVLAVLYFRLTSRFVVPISFNWSVALRLLRTGLPIALIILSDTLLRTVDALVVGACYDVDKALRFGWYTVAMQVATYLYRIPEAGGFVIMPRILESYAANGDAARVRRQIMLPTIASATVMPVAAGIAFIMLPPLIRTVIPRFEGAIFAAQVLSLGSVLLALPIAANGLLIALNREFVVVLNKGLGALITGSLAFWQVSVGGSLRSIAVAACVGYGVAALLSLIQVLRRYYKSRLDLLTQLALCHIPLAWCVVALRVSGLLTRSGSDPLVSDWVRAIVRLLIFVAMMIPVLLYGNAQTGLFREFGRMARKALRKRKSGIDG